ncbi:MAG: ribonuclease P protein component [Gallionella sp.]|nr:ribonuclease P protein component [Gallionella sp.]
MLKAVQDSRCKKKYAFGAGQRIPSPEGFARCLKSKSISNQYYKLYFVANNEKVARLGIIASKRCMHKAVERNKNKRTVREVFRSHPVKDNKLDLVVQIRRASALTLAIQRVELASLFSQLEVRCA